jgi:alkylresorcinol/alkylpyrone synthase
MPRIVAAASALPPHDIPQGAVRDAVSGLFAGRLPGLEQLLCVFAHARVERRRFIRPLDWYLSPRTASERNRAYLEDGLSLLTDAAERCLARAKVEAAQVDAVVAVSTTGLATPSLDARLAGRLGLRPGIVRLPLWGLGCAGGAAGLARARDYCVAHPRARVLVATLETCSLTFVAGDASRKNLVGTALFADGAAAVLVAGAQVGGGAPRLRAARSHLFPDSERIMGWDFGDAGMELVLSPRLPAIVREELPALVDAFLADNGLSRREIVHYITHPGGAKVIDAYRGALGLDGGELALTEAVLREHGNVSSVSVLLVLERWLATAPRPGYGLLSAFGPGFAAEQLLLEV